MVRFLLLLCMVDRKKNDGQAHIQEMRQKIWIHSCYSYFMSKNVFSSHWASMHALNVNSQRIFFRGNSVRIYTRCCKIGLRHRRRCFKPLRAGVSVPRCWRIPVFYRGYGLKGFGRTCDSVKVQNK